MTKATLAARLILGLLFVFFALNFWFNFVANPPKNGDAATFLGVLFTSGFLTAVKVLELAGGLMLLARRTALGLLLLGPVIVNILLFDLFLGKALNPPGLLAAVLALFLLYTERPRFLPLLGKATA
jgi:hypothetical protein